MRRIIAVAAVGMAAIVGTLGITESGASAMSHRMSFRGSKGATYLEIEVIVLEAADPTQGTDPILLAADVDLDPDGLTS